MNDPADNETARAEVWDAFDGTYALLDHGGSERLERIGGVVVRRPSPVSVGTRHLPAEAWEADLRWDAGRGEWEGSVPEGWCARWRDVVLTLHQGGAGQVGLFPEQAWNWAWLRNVIRDANRSLDILNGFAHTGGTTLAACVSGTRVVHLDAAAPSVKRARLNAARSGSESHPVRWLVEDGMTFLRREIRRGQRYEGLVFDPPAYGRGRGRKAWKLERDLPELLEAARALLAERPAFFLLTCHAPGWGVEDMCRVVRAAGLAERGEMTGCELRIPVAGGEAEGLPAGVACRVVYGNER